MNTLYGAMVFIPDDTDNHLSETLTQIAKKCSSYKYHETVLFIRRSSSQYPQKYLIFVVVKIGKAEDLCKEY